MILADRRAFSRLQIELVTVESSVSPSLRKSHSADGYAAVPVLDASSSMHCVVRLRRVLELGCTEAWLVSVG